MTSGLLVEENNLSVAWGKAFFAVVSAGEIAPLVVVIKGLDNAEIPQVQAIREALDEALRAEGKGLSCHTVANTIFPSMWNPKADRQELYRRYLKVLPRLRKYNRYGLYFERLISFGHDGKFQGGVNQLEHIIQTWQAGNHRRTALQAAVLDPHRDHTNQPRRGFPCLQQVAFAPVGAHGLAVTAFYATQYMFERAYGNYLGLCRLGHFMAHEMERTLERVTCIAAPAVRDRSKGTLAKLAETIKAILEQFETASPASPEGCARG